VSARGHTIGVTSCPSVLPATLEATGIDLARAGHEVDIVGRPDHLRVNGSPIDVRGDALETAEQMGILETVHERRITMTQQTTFVVRSGAVVASLVMEEINESSDDIELPPRGPHGGVRRLVFGPEKDDAIAQIHMSTWHRGRVVLIGDAAHCVGFAWVGYETFVKRALTHPTLHIPWSSLGAVALTAALAGLLASVLPARRAARVPRRQGYPSTDTRRPPGG
jgi:hypothetical protein